MIDALHELAAVLVSSSGFGDTSPTPVAITVTVKGHNHFDVHCGETYCTHLCWDEMLGQIATLTLTGKSRYPMLTPEEHAEREERMQARARAAREEEQTQRRNAA